MKRRRTHKTWIASSLLFLSVVAAGGALAGWKHATLAEEAAAAAAEPEPAEAVTVAVARAETHRRTMTAIGTVLALQSITLRNELAGTVREARLAPGVVEEGDLLVQLDVSVEEAELAAREAELVHAEAQLRRVSSLGEAVAEMEVDRARADRDVARAEIERVRALIAKKTIRAPFRARVGLSDVHLGQYLNEGTVLTTLQGVADAVHVDFAVPQQVAAGLREQDVVEIVARSGGEPLDAHVVAVDARVDAATRNATVRARVDLDGPGGELAPGAAVRVRVAVDRPRDGVAIPATALRKGPEGDHVFVIEPDGDGRARAHARPVETGVMLGDEVLVHAGLAAGEQVAASGSFKLRDRTLVAVAGR
jgi:membrane fusion protein (multidrug efflux system)